VWAGPVAGQTLGFLGAEVYKIESRARIDLTRMLPPFGGGVRDPDRSLSNHACWAGNGSVSLNLKKPEARALARQLIAKCDVVIENFGPGVMESLDLGWETLRAVKSDLVMFSMPAAGLTGPLKDIRTYGLSLTSTTGLDSLTGSLPSTVTGSMSSPGSCPRSTRGITRRSTAAGTTCTASSTPTRPTRSRSRSSASRSRH
jgi:benzylsuccinate CoA-transferase BbsF subunit